MTENIDELLDLYAAEDAGRRRGWKALSLDTLVDTYGAQRTYERLGFSCLGPVHLAYGSYMDTEDRAS